MMAARTTAVPAYLSFEAEVSAVRRISPTFLRVTFTGDFAGLHDGGPLGPRDMRIKLIVPAVPGTRPAVDLDLADDGWYRRWLTLDPQVRGHMRTYTVREARLHRAEPEIDVDFVLHLDDHGRGGPATEWAAAAAVGDQVTLLGPNRHSQPAGGIEWHPPAPAAGQPQPVLLAGDETACPAIASILRTLGPGHIGHALIEVPDAADVQQLDAPPEVEVRWLVRDDGCHGDLLRHAVEQVMASRPARSAYAVDLPEVDVDAEILWETPKASGGSAPEAFRGSDCGRACLYAWIAGEAGTVRDIRRSLVQAHGLARSQVAFMGYWRRGRPEAG